MNNTETKIHTKRVGFPLFGFTCEGSVVVRGDVRTWHVALTKDGDVVRHFVTEDLTEVLDFAARA